MTQSSKKIDPDKLKRTTKPMGKTDKDTRSVPVSAGAVERHWTWPLILQEIKYVK